MATESLQHLFFWQSSMLTSTCPRGLPSCADPSLAGASVGRRNRTGEPRPCRATAPSPKHRNKTNMLTVACCFVFGPWRLVPPTDLKLEPGWQRTVRVKSGKAVKAVREGDWNRLWWAHLKNTIFAFNVSFNQWELSHRWDGTTQEPPKSNRRYTIKCPTRRLHHSGV